MSLAEGLRLHGRDADEVLVSHNTRRRIEVDPARTWNVSLDPSVGVTTSNLMLVFVLLFGQMQVVESECDAVVVG